MLVDEYNKVIEIAETIYAIGDSCLQKTDIDFPLGHPQLAQVAIQQGKTLAKNLIAMSSEKRMQPFKYFDKGVMAMIGRNTAVVDLPFLHFAF